MSFTALFYTFSKRINSTKQPTGTGTSYDIILKDGSSAISPSIQLDVGQSGNPTALNYCYIAAFNRYYWVSDWYFRGRLWEAHLKCDVLASFKAAIGSTTAYVSRAASSYDGDIVDRYYPAIAENTQSANTVTSEFTTDLDSGSYVIGIQGKGSGGNGGAVTYYTATAAGMKSLVNYMLSDPTIYNVSDITEELLKCVFNPLQYIVSCMWFPFSTISTSGSVDFGWWTASVSGIHRLGGGLRWTRNQSFTIPKHPKAASRGNYLNLPPFSSYALEAGPFGVIPLDPFNLIDTTSLGVVYNVDLMTGTGRIGIKQRDHVVYLEEHTAQIGVPIQLGQNMFNQGAVVNAASEVSGTIGSLLSGNVTGALVNGLSAIGDAAMATQGIPSSIGSNGSISFNNIFGIIANFLDIVDEDLTSRGRPLCKSRQLSGLSGYIMCEDADPQISCTDAELREVVSYLNGGFYYE